MKTALEALTSELEITKADSGLSAMKEKLDSLEKRIASVRFAIIKSESGLAFNIKG